MPQGLALSLLDELGDLGWQVWKSQKKDGIESRSCINHLLQGGPRISDLRDKEPKESDEEESALKWCSGVSGRGPGHLLTDTFFHLTYPRAGRIGP